MKLCLDVFYKGELVVARTFDGVDAEYVAVELFCGVNWVHEYGKEAKAFLLQFAALFAMNVTTHEYLASVNEIMGYKGKHLEIHGHFVETDGQ